MVARLVDNDPLPLLVNAITDELARQGAGVFDHNGMTEENYRIAVGYVRALLWVMAAINDLNKKQEEA